MADLSFQVKSVEPVGFAASPLLAVQLAIRNADPDEPIQNILLQAQVQIEATRRQYQPEEKARLLDLFGEPERWGQTLRGLLWTHATTTVRAFTGETTANLHIPCSFDFNVAATKYFDGIETGEVPVLLLFSGTVFYQTDDGVQVAQLPWNLEARFSLPIATWRELMDHYYPNSAWLNLRRDVFDRLHEYKRQRGIATWEQTLEQLLA